MFVLDHVSIAVHDIETARSFYDAAMGALGVPKVYDRPDALGYGLRCDAGDDSRSCFAIYATENKNVDDRRHWCFKAATRAQVRAFHAAGLAHGGTDEGPPGLRPHYHSHYYGAFLRDPAGNRIEAVCHREE
jgi:catechol 2,3-dioxygenase-like lactoylglutathione lyase family enzyme